jgi:hypothetical protein
MNRKLIMDSVYGKPVSEHGAVSSSILTEEEAIHWLRLDGPDAPKDAKGTLRYYREKGLLRAIRIGRHNRYFLPELERFCERLLQRKGDE